MCVWASKPGGCRPAVILILAFDSKHRPHRLACDHANSGQCPLCHSGLINSPPRTHTLACLQHTCTHINKHTDIHKQTHTLPHKHTYTNKRICHTHTRKLTFTHITKTNAQTHAHTHTQKQKPFPAHTHTHTHIARCSIAEGAPLVQMQDAALRLLVWGGSVCQSSSLHHHFLPLASQLWILLNGSNTLFPVSLRLAHFISIQCWCGMAEYNVWFRGRPRHLAGGGWRVTWKG